MHWEQDAKYYYYLHGPLIRTELGELKVQGMYYAYTMHGWLKSVNGTTLDYTLDFGKDGYYNLSGNTHANMARDAFAFALDYYEGDYNNTGNVNVMPNSSGKDISAQLVDLFNGNIRSMLTGLPDLSQYNALT